nr:MAG TPA: hypothetical protein [Caudoviricetes sp.]
MKGNFFSLLSFFTIFYFYQVIYSHWQDILSLI